MAKKKKIIIWIIIIIVIAGGIKIFTSKEPKIEYTTEKVERKDVVQTVSVTGELVSTDQADLTFEISGRVESVNFDIGDQIKKGDEVARLDDRILRKQLTQTVEDNNVQQENLDLARRTWDDFKPEEKGAKKAAVRKTQAAVEAANVQLSKTVLYSPISGIVIKRNVDPGENVTAGAALVSSNSAVVSIAKEGDFEIETNIPESDIIKVIVGQIAKVTFDALSSADVFEAEVTEVEPSATVIQDVVYYVVKLKIKNIDSRLKDGMSVDVDINTNEKSDVLAIPQRAIRNGDGKKRVQILPENGEIEEKEVTTGLKGDNGLIEITSGLSGGEQVVTFTSEE
ncbi:efflux RND transporter periplasmic adaptor subunit [Patescibacteria group bacterium]